MISEMEANLVIFIQRANGLEISQRIELYNSFADEIIGAAAGQVNTKEGHFLRTLPFLIIGALDAKNIPATKKNLQDAIKIIIDEVTIGYKLHPVEYMDEDMGLDFIEEPPNNEDADSQAKIAKFQERIATLFAVPRQVRLVCMTE